MTKPTLYYAGQPGNTFGWGVCNRYLIAELSKLTELTALTEKHPLWHAQDLPGTYFTPLGNHELVPTAPGRGRRNLGYTFFEMEPNTRSIENARRFDVIFGGSSWCVERMKAHGIENAVPLVQGVDGQIFHPRTFPRNDGRFAIFSGGKLELRKGQDLVLRAFAILHRKYSDLVLVTAWFNHWPEGMATMRHSRHIRFEPVAGSWTEQMNHLYRLNGVDPRRVITLPLLGQQGMADVYNQTDVGVFPNRCEGGTNLVLMEYMACGRPAIVANGTGHRDIVTEVNALRLQQLRPLNYEGAGKEIISRWVEPSLDEIIARLEFAYQNRDAAAKLGARGAEDMKHWTWERAARTVLPYVE